MSSHASPNHTFSAIDGFLAQDVQKLDIATLKEEETCCPICQDDFDTGNEGIPAHILEIFHCLDHLPFCRRKFFNNRIIKLGLVQEYNRRLREISNLPLRRLLTQNWSEEDTVFFENEEVRDVLACILSRLIMDLAARVQRPALPKELDYPFVSLKCGSDDEASFANFVRCYLGKFFMLNDELEPHQPFIKIVRDPLTASAYANICKFFRTMKSNSTTDGHIYNSEFCKIIKRGSGFEANIKSPDKYLKTVFQGENTFEYEYGVGLEVRRIMELSVRAMLERQRGINLLNEEEEFEELMEVTHSEESDDDEE